MWNAVFFFLYYIRLCKQVGKFTIVGNGIGYDKLQETSVLLGCKRVVFVGYQNPLAYYKRASCLSWHHQRNGL